MLQQVSFWRSVWRDSRIPATIARAQRSRNKLVLIRQGRFVLVHLVLQSFALAQLRLLQAIESGNATVVIGADKAIVPFGG